MPRRSSASLDADLLQGTLDLLVLQTLALEPRHGVGVSDGIAQITRGTFTLGPGSLFPALNRMLPPNVLSESSTVKGWLPVV